MSITTDIQCYGPSIFAKYCIEAKKRADRNLHASSDIAVLYADERIAELLAENVKLEYTNRGLVKWTHEHNAALREGIKEHSQCFNPDEGDPHDLALWALLQENK